jgi:hypothetical protein
MILALGTIASRLIGYGTVMVPDVVVALAATVRSAEKMQKTGKLRK